MTHALARQLAHPTGVGGLLLGKAMDLANRGPTRRAIELLQPRPDEAILDAGCGTGRGLAQVLDTGAFRVAGLDPSAKMLEDARRRLRGQAELRRGTIEQNLFDDQHFDAIVALNVLYFAKSDGAMARALYRMLIPGGRLVAYVTARETMERWRFTRAGYHRLFDAHELAVLLTDGGFDPDKISILREPVGFGAVGLFAYAMR